MDPFVVDFDNVHVPVFCYGFFPHKLRGVKIGKQTHVAPSGRRYTVHHFTVFFESTVSPELRDSIDQFQFIQHKDGTTTLNIVVNDRYDSSVGQFLAECWSNEFGATVEVNVVERIPIMGNNKRRFIMVEAAQNPYHTADI